MNLAELEQACFCYGSETKYDRSYLQFLQTINSILDLNNEEHRFALMKWLNHWGCRQFSKEYHDFAQKKLHVWYKEYADQLFTVNRNLWEFGGEDLPIIRNLYESLLNLEASYYSRGNKIILKRFGPTGAAKILFAIRPKCFAPWDKAIRNYFGYDKSPDSYVLYIQNINNKLHSLELNGFTLAELPEKIHRPNSSVPKIIDEYFFVTIRNMRL
ncbi:MAG: hypothetical protein R6W90_08995 [Ignavibacteriaceae bacterium]